LIGAALAAAPISTARHSGVPSSRAVLAVRGVIRSIAPSPQRLVWIDSTWGLHVERPGRSTPTVRYTSRYEEGGDPDLVLGGSRPVWLSDRGFPTETQRVFTLTAAGRAVAVARAQHLDRGDGGFISAVAGDPSGAAFGRATVEQTAESRTRGCLCQFKLVGGGVSTVADGVARVVPQLPPPALLARSGARVALLPATTRVRRTGQPAPDRGASVMVASLADGSSVSSFVPAGTVQAIALSRRNVYVLVTATGKERLEIHTAATGALLRLAAVPAHLADELVVTPDDRVLYHDRHTIWALAAANGRASVVRRTAWSVTQIAATGKTVSWIERHILITGDDSAKGNRSRVVEATLP
jgi:hypothetical protein